MKKLLAASALLIAGVLASSVVADDSLARFKGGIGVLPVSSGVGTGATAEVVNRNIVRGVQPAGQIWVIRRLEAEVSISGQILVEGKGLLLGGGNNIGFTGGQSVFATLICAAEEPNSFTQSSSNLAGVPLEADGDFTIDDLLAPAPAFPCNNPVLLIRSAASTSWFAAGIPKSEDDVDADDEQ
ncbi:hypothetical protein D3880_08695 [Pseudomonas cavernae]|uniref:Pilin n=1 Tax=Pseudomonas cavernae TaxID=2320867 RepID=A0A385YZT0_9PSED|nr:hypothetical protein [Pseudomonas cavernae]AYC32449.1 hypothetical protein D3880_08695 [Pseudomonas cavernae]